MIKLILYVVYLYKIYWLFCYEKGCVNKYGIDVFYFEKNYVGFRYLMSFGFGCCKIEVFDNEVWMKLIFVLCLLEKERGKYFVKYLMKYCVGRSRKREDIFIKKDFNFIKKYLFKKGIKEVI